MSKTESISAWNWPRRPRRPLRPLVRAMGTLGAAALVALVWISLANAALSTGPTGAKTWYWQNPNPQGNALLGVDVAGTSEVWAVGGPGVVLHSSDGGVVWAPQDPGTDVILRAVAFADDSAGWVAGDSGVVRKTVDGGDTWVAQSQANTTALRGLAAPSASVAWVVGSSGVVRKTTNGGSTWTAQTSSPSAQFNDVCAVDSQRAWIVGNGGTIRATTDGGATWVVQSSGTTVNLLGVDFIDANTGWAVGNASGGVSTVLKTTNGGATWTAQITGATTNLLSVSFVDSQTGWVVGASGAIRYTTDGGATWTAQTSGSLAFNGVAAFDSSRAAAVGAAGVLVRTMNAGATWLSQSTGTTIRIRGTSFVNSMLGWAVGDSGQVLQTVDGGDTWVRSSAGTGTWMATAFADAQTGWIVGAGGAIRKTTDGGVTWSTQVSGTSQQLNSVCIAGGSTAYAAGNGGVILKTTDGGANWVAQTSGVSTTLNDICFLSPTVGYAVGASGVIRKTIDGGATWTTSTSGTTSALYCVHAVDASRVWVSGASGLIRTTSNGGTSWSAQTSGTSSALYCVYMLDANTGWAVGASGAIRRTTNGGSTWTGQTSGTTGTLYSLAVSDSSNAVAVGDAGAIRRTTDGGASWISETLGTVVNLLDLSIPSSTAGWAVGASGAIVQTLDGGISWATLVSGVTTTLRSVDFPSGAKGWAVGDSGRILATSNGTTWTAQTSGVSTALNGVDFVDNTHGWVVGASGVILATTNGGANWVPQSSATTTALTAVSFADRSNGWAVGGASGQPAVILRTTDGGSTWTPQSAGVANGVVLRSVHAHSASTGWVTGDGGNIRKTTDGGANWNAQPSGTTTALYDVRFRDANNGFAVGGVANVPAIIRKTEDGGSTWTTQTPGTMNILRAVQFTTANHGWIVGDTGTILRTTDNTAPNTSIAFDPPAPNGSSGWFTTPMSFQLISDEPGITYYSLISSTGPWSTYSEPVSISTEGSTNVWYYSIDPGANKEVVRQATVAIDTVLPPVPTALRATPTSTSTVELRWSAESDSESGLSHHEIWMDGSRIATSSVLPFGFAPLRFVPAGNLIATASSESFTVSGLSTESSHTFAVKSVDTAGNVSSASATVSAITLAETSRPPAIAYARAVINGEVYLGWTESTGTVDPIEYRIFRSVAGGPESLVGTTSASAVRSFVDTSAPDVSLVSYSISVVDSRGEGPTSTAVPSLATTTPALPAPVALSAVPTSGEIALSWTRPKTGAGIVGYRVFRSDSSTSTPTTLTASVIATTTYADTTAQPHEEYWYRVEAISDTVTTGRKSAPVYARAVATATVDPPHGTYNATTSMCVVCHAPHSATSVFGLFNTGTTDDVGLCLSCHDGTSAPDILTELADPSRPSRHPVAAGDNEGHLSCSDCHDPHMGGKPDSAVALLDHGDEETPNSACYRCHGETSPVGPRGDLSGFERSTHATRVAEPADGTGVVCLTCHVSHSSKEPSLVPLSDDDRCLNCHSAGGGAVGDADIAVRLGESDPSTRHDLLKDDQAAGSRMSCGNCHEPHTSTATSPTVDPNNPKTTGVWAGSIDSFCLRCHDASLPTSAETSGWVAPPLARSGAATTTDIAATWAGSVHGDATGTPQYLRADMGYSAEDKLTCDSCHDPHGSPNRSTLAASVSSEDGTRVVSGLLVYPMAGGGADVRFFCASCHDVGPANHPDPGSGGADLSVWPLDCTSCHAHSGSGL